MAEGVSIILTTVANDQQAAELGDMLLNEQLAACIQEIPIRSRYRWKGAIQCDSEVLMLVKTAHDRVAAAVDAIRKSHRYELPEILVVPSSTGLAEYVAWVSAETATR
jgi:periplasmic divalent cation tolerance protein